MSDHPAKHPGSAPDGVAVRSAERRGDRGIRAGLRGAPVRAILTASCPEASGVLALVSRFLADFGIFPGEMPHFADPQTDRFFLRLAFDISASELAAVRRDFEPIAQRLRMDWAIADAAAPDRALILVSRAGHCAAELLQRWQAGLLPVDLRAIVSNHLEAAALAQAYDLPFYHLPVTPESRRWQEARLEEIIAELAIDLVVLARYMQILPPQLCARLHGRCINIHHSFLPSFKGAKAYHQAHARGVKFIGATAHYVVADLDDGPIIEQVVERVDHSQTPEDFVRIGRDLERAALARAVQWHTERRVVVTGGRTVIFK